MQLETAVIEIQRTGSTAKLLFQGRPFGHEVPISLGELDTLIAELIREAGKWRAEVSDKEQLHEDT